MARPRRPVPERPKRRSLWVFTEGKVTEEGYLNHYRRRHRNTVLTIDRFHGPPLPLVERAVQKKRSEELNERRGRGWAPDEYWCLFDVDTHPGVSQAIALAAEEGVGLAISSPCIELWFVLHFQEIAAHIAARAAQRLAEQHLSEGKRLTDADLRALVERYEDARGRAVALDEKHRGDGRALPANPGSDAWRLIDAITGGTN